MWEILALFGAIVFGCAAADSQARGFVFLILAGLATLCANYYLVSVLTLP